MAAMQLSSHLYPECYSNGISFVSYSAVLLWSRKRLPVNAATISCNEGWRGYFWISRTSKTKSIRFLSRVPSLVLPTVNARIASLNKTMCCVKSDFIVRHFKVMRCQAIRPISVTAARSAKKLRPFNSDQYASDQASPTPHTHSQVRQTERDAHLIKR